MLLLVDENIRKEVTRYHPWQVNFLKEFGKACLASTSQNPNKAILVAANGAGKDERILAPIIVWYACRFVQANIVFTTASGTQLTSQSEPNIRRLAGKVNTWLESKGKSVRLVIQQRKLISEFSGAVCSMFATDDEGKAEGYHPVDGCKQIIIVNEGKSIKPSIYQALRTCHGYSDWLEVSSSGEEAGDFYQNYLSPTFKLKKVINIEECPHLSREEYEHNLAQFGRDHPFIKSSYWSEFVSQESQVIITEKQIRDCLEAKIPEKRIRLSLGLDVSAVCDETVLTAYNGSKFIRSWQRQGFANMSIQKDWLISIFNELNPDVIYIDYGGLGRGLVDDLINKEGFKQVVPVNFGGSAIRKNLYADRGAELWSNVRRLIEAKLIEIDKSDTKLIAQLSTRRYKLLDGGKIKLEPKKDAKARGVKSPDRADSLVLALSGYQFDELSLTAPSSVPADSKNLIPLETYLKNQFKSQRTTQPWVNLWLEN